MNILFLSTWHPYPPNNGSKQRAFYLLKALAAQHTVTAVAFRSVPDEEQGDTNVHAIQQPVIAVLDDPFHSVNAPQWVKYLSVSPLAFRPSPSMQAAVTTAALHGSWDAVVALQMPVAQYAGQVQATARIIDVDTALSYQLRERYRAEQRPLARTSAWISWQKARRYESNMLRHFHAATVVWQAEVELLQQMVRRQTCAVVVVANGVDCTHNRPDLRQPQPNSLVFNGSLTYSANYDAMRWFLAEVYPLIKAEQSGVSLTITGSTAGVDLVGLAIDDTVHLTGFVDDVRLPVAVAAVAIAPLRQGGGTRLKILEAMALGTPVVATSKAAEGLDVTDGEHLVIADTPADFACATLALLTNAELCARIAVNARHLVEVKYEWQEIGSRFVALVESTVTDHKNRQFEGG